jgi:type IV pilus assembly protein PilA
MLEKFRQVQERRANGDKGFTLIELLVVVVIIGILIAIAIPLYLNYEKGAKNKSAESDVRNAVSTLENCNTPDNGGYPTAVSTAGVMTGCGGGTLKLSSDVTVVYTYTAGPPATYKITATNSGGDKTYCYNSANGGSVKAASTC